MDHIITKAQEIVQQCIETAVDVYGVSMYPIRIETSNRMTRTWAYATRNSSGYYLIKINSKIFDKETVNTDVFRDLIVHEFCHLLEHQVNKKWSHGPTWARYMQNFGIPANRLVTKEEKEIVGYVRVVRQTTKYAHACDCKSHAVGGRVHIKITNGIRYTCKHCRSALSTTFYVINPRG